MLYPYMTLNDETEIAYSEMNPDGRVKVVMETPDDEPDLFPDDDYFESDLKKALITHLVKYLLESERGFSFAARQRRIVIDGLQFRIDLVFYHYILKCHVLVDLKIGNLTHQDLEQMQMYMLYYEREQMSEGDSPPIGIVLCANKSESAVRYLLPETETQDFATRYKSCLPTQEELQREIKQEFSAWVSSMHAL